MKKNLGIVGLFAVVFLFTALMSDNFINAYNLENLIRRSSLYGIMGIAVSFVIVTGGIDLSIGSLIGLVGCLLPWLLVTQGWSLTASLMFVTGISVVIGLCHGQLITRLRLQPFIVTLCGLLIYRGAARWITSDRTQGFGLGGYEGLRKLALGKIPLGNWPRIGQFNLPVPFLILLLIAVVAAVFLNRTIHGRYLLALGRNEKAARFSGINTDRMAIIAYLICSLITGFSGILWAAYTGSIQPDSFATGYELYAIAAAVLGGCSLRGGEVSIFGVVVGAALIPLIVNALSMLGVNDTLEPAVLGGVIMAGVIADELAKRFAARRRAVQQARQAAAG